MNHPVYTHTAKETAGFAIMSACIVGFAAFLGGIMLAESNMRANMPASTPTCNAIVTSLDVLERQPKDVVRTVDGDWCVITW